MGPCRMNRDYDQILSALRRSSFRSGFKLAKRYQIYVQEKGLETIRRHAADFIQSRIAPAFPKNDGKQTPMKNHPVFIAQHATGTCCRGCLEKWYGIEKGRALTGAEIDFVIELIMQWVERNAEGRGYLLDLPDAFRHSSRPNPSVLHQVLPESG